METASVESELQETAIAEITLAVTSLAKNHASVETTLSENLGGNHISESHPTRNHLRIIGIIEIMD